MSSNMIIFVLSLFVLLLGQPEQVESAKWDFYGSASAQVTPRRSTVVRSINVANSKINSAPPYYGDQRNSIQINRQVPKTTKSYQEIAKGLSEKWLDYMIEATPGIIYDSFENEAKNVNPTTIYPFGSYTSNKPAQMKSVESSGWNACVWTDDIKHSDFVSGLVAANVRIYPSGLSSTAFVNWVQQFVHRAIYLLPNKHSLRFTPVLQTRVRGLVERTLTNAVRTRIPQQASIDLTIAKVQTGCIKYQGVSTFASYPTQIKSLGFKCYLALKPGLSFNSFVHSMNALHNDQMMMRPVQYSTPDAIPIPELCVSSSCELTRRPLFSEDIRDRVSTQTVMAANSAFLFWISDFSNVKVWRVGDGPAVTDMSFRVEGRGTIDLLAANDFFVFYKDTTGLCSWTIGDVRFECTRRLTSSADDISLITANREWLFWKQGGQLLAWRVRDDYPFQVDWVLSTTASSIALIAANDRFIFWKSTAASLPKIFVWEISNTIPFLVTKVIDTDASDIIGLSCSDRHLIWRDSSVTPFRLVSWDMYGTLSPPLRDAFARSIFAEATILSANTPSIFSGNSGDLFWINNQQQMVMWSKRAGNMQADRVLLNSASTISMLASNDMYVYYKDVSTSPPRFMSWPFDDAVGITSPQLTVFSSDASTITMLTANNDCVFWKSGSPPRLFSWTVKPFRTLTVEWTSTLDATRISAMVSCAEYFIWKEEVTTPGTPSRLNAWKIGTSQSCTLDAAEEVTTLSLNANGISSLACVGDYLVSRSTSGVITTWNMYGSTQLSDNPDSLGGSTSIPQRFSSSSRSDGFTGSVALGDVSKPPDWTAHFMPTCIGNQTTLPDLLLYQSMDQGRFCTYLQYRPTNPAVSLGNCPWSGTMPEGSVCYQGCNVGYIYLGGGLMRCANNNVTGIVPTCVLASTVGNATIPVLSETAGDGFCNDQQYAQFLTQFESISSSPIVTLGSCPSSGYMPNHSACVLQCGTNYIYSGGGRAVCVNGGTSIVEPNCVDEATLGSAVVPVFNATTVPAIGFCRASQYAAKARQHSALALGSCVTTGYMPENSTCVFSCNSGYIYIGGGEMLCLNSVVSGVMPTCVAISSIGNAVPPVITGSTIAGQHCTADAYATMVTNSVNIMNNSVMLGSCPVVGNMPESSRCSLVCATGYESSWLEIRGTLNCSRGVLVGSVPTCRQILPTSTNACAYQEYRSIVLRNPALTLGTCPYLAYMPAGQSCMLNCTTDYISIRDGTLVCQAGRVVGDEPACVARSTLGNANVTMYPSGAATSRFCKADRYALYLYGGIALGSCPSSGALPEFSYCHLRCAPGYLYVNGGGMYCENGSPSGIEPYCVAESTLGGAVLPVFPGGTTTGRFCHAGQFPPYIRLLSPVVSLGSCPSSGYIPEFGSCQFRCNVGYIYRGGGSMVCENGGISGVEPTCVLESSLGGAPVPFIAGATTAGRFCQAAQFTAYIKLLAPVVSLGSCQSSGYIPGNSGCSFRCNPGYIYSGGGGMFCEDAAISGVEPNCIAAATLGSAVVPVFDWTTQGRFCQASQYAAQIPQNGVVTLGSCVTTGYMPENSTCVFSCISGHIYIGGGEMACSNRVVSGVMPTCVAIASLGSAVLPVITSTISQFGYCEASSYMNLLASSTTLMMGSCPVSGRLPYGAQCSFACLDGARMQTQQWMTCSGGGQVSGTLPVCVEQPNLCDLSPYQVALPGWAPIDNGNCPAFSALAPGSACQQTCDPGYVIVGGSGLGCMNGTVTHNSTILYKSSAGSSTAAAGTGGINSAARTTLGSLQLVSGVVSLVMIMML